MTGLTQIFPEQSLVWLLLTAIVSTSFGFLSSWLTYRYVKKQEFIDTVRAEIDKQRGVQKLETEGERQERIRREVIRWANPILDSVRSLKSQLNNILNDAGYLAMTRNYKELVNPNWSISYDYFMSSTLFLFGQYFAWVQMLQEELNFELFKSQAEKNEFFTAIWKVHRSLGSFPPYYLADASPCNGKDTQVFHLQQRAIGELFIVREKEERRCLSYAEFLQKIEETHFQTVLAPLRVLLEDLSPEQDCRWKRVQATFRELTALETVCEKLLNLPLKS